jgi:hypothetical protein
MVYHGNGMGEEVYGPCSLGSDRWREPHGSVSRLVGSLGSRSLQTLNVTDFKLSMFFIRGFVPNSFFENTIFLAAEYSIFPIYFLNHPVAKLAKREKGEEAGGGFFLLIVGRP